jgi:hypothetical protein
VGLVQGSTWRPHTRASAPWKAAAAARRSTRRF